MQERDTSMYQERGRAGNDMQERGDLLGTIYGHEGQQVAAVTKAVAAFGSGMGGAFLQNQSADVLRKLLQLSSAIADANRDDVTAFLSEIQDSEYSPASGEITDIIKSLIDEMI